MSQSKVSDFFATRKRNRFNQDDVLLNKQTNKSAKLIDPIDLVKASMTNSSTRTTRSKAALEQQPSQPMPQQQQPEEVKENENVEEKSTTRGRRNKKQEAKELAERIQSFDEKVKLVRGGRKKANGKDEKEKENEEAPEEKGTVVEQTPAPVVVEAQPTVKEAAKPKASLEVKKLKMLEMRQKIQQFNQNLVVMKEKAEKSKREEKQEKEKAAAAEQAKQMPAYMKFNELSSKEAESTLSLPKSFSNLLDSFKASDTIVKFISGRQEVCTFLKLKLGIQNITKLRFELTNLGQIKSVYPEAYLYAQEKLFVDFKNDYHLTISPNFDEIEADPITGTKYFSPHVLLQRLNKFKANLINILKKLHSEFLLTLNITVNDDELKRWHPKFDIENVKPIEPAELPKQPIEQMKTGKDLLSIAKDVYSNRIKEAINGFVAESNAKKTDIEAACSTVELVVVKNSDQAAVKCSETTLKSESTEIKVVQVEGTTNKSTGDIDKQLKEKKEKGYNDLLERIRAKEKAKAIETMIINSDREKELAKLSNYLEAIRLLMFYYDSEKKSVLELNKVVQTMSDSLNCKLNFLECKELLESMCQEEMFKNESGQPWLNILKVRIQFFVKMDKSFELNYLNEKVQKAMDEIKKSS